MSTTGCCPRRWGVVPAPAGPVAGIAAGGGAVAEAAGAVALTGAAAGGAGAAAAAGTHWDCWDCRALEAVANHAAKQNVKGN